MTFRWLVITWAAGLLFVGVASAEPPISPDTQNCIECHSSATPGIVADWRKSRHAMTTPAEALKKPELQRRVSAEKVPDGSAGYVVGCAECHGANLSDHKDTFSHNDQKVHLTVTPKDCAKCHPVESEEYKENLMAHAWGNLAKNPVFHNLTLVANSTQTFKDMKTTMTPPNEKTEADSCFHCHGTVLEVKGTKKRDTDYGEMEFPVMSGWPNQGVGRLNPDGSMGTCTPCHSRHQFSISVARKPYTCSQCHKGPDVPAYQAYSVSKHGNLQLSLWNEWDFKGVPWTVGKDFTAPTCATCHVSLIVTEDGTVINKRTHRMNDRLPWRLFGLVYAHPHPKSPDTSIIRNKDNQPLPTTLNDEPATDFLIDPAEQTERKDNLQKVCMACHSRDWVQGHWERFENPIKTSNDMTRASCDIIAKAWAERVADQSAGWFDEAIEKQWVEEWLFFANSTRFASAMMGADYGVFAHGRWQMAKNIQEMLDHYKFLKGIQGKSGASAPKPK